ncbi:MAG: hypothetical protein GVY12_06755 [Bacteroidetes bacterium]|nr:hypothetical protein [Bacteroidota bacterium]
MSESSHSALLMDYFQDLEDPRMDRRKDHPLVNVLFIAMCAAYGGAEGWRSIETFGQAKQDWLARYLRLPEGHTQCPQTIRTAGRLVGLIQKPLRRRFANGWRRLRSGLTERLSPWTARRCAAPAIEMPTRYGLRGRRRSPSIL